MPVALGVNGFGRIGRTVLRALIASGRDDLKVVAINDPAPIDTCAHLLEFDSVHGRLGREVVVRGTTIDAGTGPIRVSHEMAPEKVDWTGVDIVLECTGAFRDPALALRHLDGGAGKVLISAPAEGAGAPTVVFGINHDSLRGDDRIVSNASCTTNCLVPVAQALHAAFGIRHGHMTTVHSYTGNQPVHDRAHADLYRARAAGMSMIPTSTGAADTMALVLPDLAGRITGTAIRVPAPNVSCIDLVVELDRATSTAEVNDALRAAAEAQPRILGLTTRKLVSRDFAGDARSAIIASDQTHVQNGTQARVLAWYDNEWAFSNRMLDTAAAMAAAP
ncbi:type I glyceraldehyde-3-phosphate dehydrogenase [Sulfitobacter sp. HNIBRBA3233]|uniref:type I glyceraldehyde-3-phosphate dehydrogenase n=1 Tax=Sulfitobacter marinivivus TaxID=3158558 RepID=UPI0032DF8E49